MKGKFKSPPITQGKNISALPTSGGISNNLKPKFCFEFLDNTYSVEACEQADRAAFAVQLTKIGRMSWQEIQNAPKYGLGTEKIPRSQIRAPIPPSVTPDVEFFLAFRFSAKKPMVGFRSGQLFHLLWIDRDFTLYNHG
jgi:hypothetical protein